MMPKLGFSLQKQYDRPMEDVLALLKDAGFSAVSPIYAHKAELPQIAACVRDLGMELQSFHAPNRVAPLWEEGHPGVLDEIPECIDLCKAYGIPTVIVHSWQGLEYTFPGEPLYYGNFDRLVEYAQQHHVSIAFENLEGEEYLDALMARYRDCDHVGFCWDSGHEHCYPHKLDFLQEFGDRLIMTHLNDNLGLRDPGGVPTGVDDLHYLPWDGKIDWETNLNKLAKAKKQEILNFEIKIKSISDDPKDMIYAKMSTEDFISLAGTRARQLAQRYAAI